MVTTLPHTGDANPVRRVVVASLIGTAIEWYDFMVYGTAAALVFNVLFFTDLDPVTGTMASFATFAVGFVARPVGAVVFGHFGDRIGRKSMLVLTLMIMGVATTLIGLLPTYETVGVWAPALLVTLRFSQGFAVGGEWGGAVLMAGEYAPPGRRTFFASWPQVGVPIGLLSATGVFALASWLSGDAFLVWGWRVPFLLSIVLVVVGLFVRFRIIETPQFRAIKNAQRIVRLPLADVLRTHPRNLVAALGTRVGENIAFVIWTTFVLTYATGVLGLARGTLLIGVMIGAAVSLATIPAFAALADRIGDRTVYAFGAVCAILHAFPFFWLLESGSPTWVWVAIAAGMGIAYAAMYGPQAGLFIDMFDPQVRYTGLSVSSTIAGVFAGGLAPMFATMMLDASGDAAWPLALYVAGAAVVTLLGLALARTGRAAPLEPAYRPAADPVAGDAAERRP